MNGLRELFFIFVDFFLGVDLSVIFYYMNGKVNFREWFFLLYGVDGVVDLLGVGVEVLGVGVFGVYVD